MKKFISIILCAALFTVNMSVYSVASVTEVGGDISLKDFTADLTDMINNFEQSAADDFSNLDSSQIEEYGLSANVEADSADNVSTNQIAEASTTALL